MINLSLKFTKYDNKNKESIVPKTKTTQYIAMAIESYDQSHPCLEFMYSAARCKFESQSIPYETAHQTELADRQVKIK